MLVCKNQKNFHKFYLQETFFYVHLNEKGMGAGCLFMCKLCVISLVNGEGKFYAPCSKFSCLIDWPLEA